MNKFILKYFLLISLNLLFWFAYKMLITKYSHYNISFFLRLTWTIVIFKILPHLFPSVNQLLDFIELNIKKILNRDFIKTVNRWLSVKNTITIFVFSLVITLFPLLTAEIIIFFHIKLTSKTKAFILGTLDFVYQQYLEYFLAIPTIVLFIILMKLASQYLARRTIFLLESRKKGKLRFYLVLISFILLEEILFYITRFAIPK